MASTPSHAPSPQSNASPLAVEDGSTCSSPSFADISKKLFDEDLMADCGNDGAEDASLVMTRVLAQLERIVEHLRCNGAYVGANSIAKDTINIINTFNEVAAPWDIKSSMMAPHSDSSRTDSSGEGVSPPVTSSRPTSSWAAVAAVAPAAGNRLIKFTPKDGVQTKYVEEKPKVESQDVDSRVIWIQGWKEDRPLSEVTGNIGQGPLYSMAYSVKDKSVCIIFQYASSAKALIDEDDLQVKDRGSSRFGSDCQLVMGQPFPATEEISRMVNPHNERRRLTFARQQLFTNGMTEARFRADIYAIVGQANVELIWLFNTGNATAVFTGVPIARAVRTEFRRLSNVRNSPYNGVIVSYSHDPCERPMSLITQMPAGQSLRNMGPYGGNGALPSDIVSKNGSFATRAFRHSPAGRAAGSAAGKDANGWQTVVHKRG